MKINWTKEQCIEYIENNLEKFTKNEIELYESSLKMFEISQLEISNKIALDNIQYIIKCLHDRGTYEDFKNTFIKPISFYKNDYWKERCLAAEKYIEESPCDPDIYPSQYEAYEKWLNLKNKKL